MEKSNTFVYPYYNKYCYNQNNDQMYELINFNEVNNFFYHNSQ